MRINTRAVQEQLDAVVEDYALANGTAGTGIPPQLSRTGDVTSLRRLFARQPRVLSVIAIYRQRLKPLIDGSVDTDQVRNFEEV